MADSFSFDVFLSYSSKDKPVVREIAEHLRNRGLRVWFDEWEMRPGDSISARFEEGFENSRVLVLCMSASAFSSDWAQLESSTFRFRDPLNKERRFVPLRLDDAPIKESLAQFLYINWRCAEREQAHLKLLEACRPRESAVNEQVAERVIQLDAKGVRFNAYAFSPDGGQVVTGDEGNTARLWDAETGRCLRVFKGHTAFIKDVAWNTRMNRIFSAAWSTDSSIRIWDVETGRCLRVLGGPIRTIWDMSFSGDYRRAVSVGNDEAIRVWDTDREQSINIIQAGGGCLYSTALDAGGIRALTGDGQHKVRLWNVDTGMCLCTFEGHQGCVYCVAWSPDERQVLSGAQSDNTVRVWDVETGRCLQILEGHTAAVRSLAPNPNQRHVLSGSEDTTLRLWDLESGRCLCILEGHVAKVRTVAWSADGQRAFSGDHGGEVRMWDLSEFVVRKSANGVADRGTMLAPAQVQYTNAKVLVVGDSGVGKTGLSNYLAHGVKVGDDRPLPSTDGVWATHWQLRQREKKASVEREIWLWDFAGQVDYRLVHQLFMDDTAAAVLVFNPQNEDPFEGLGQWDRDLRRASRQPFAKLLAAGRTDCGGLVVSSSSMEGFMAERGFLAPLHLTSAKTGDGCESLRGAIVKAIDWKRIPETTSPALYHRLKQEILNLRDSGLVLIRLSELNQRMEMTLGSQKFKIQELEAVVNLLAGPGMIKRLDFGGFLLLRPEVLSRYAAAVVRKLRNHPHEMGCIREDDFLAGKLDYQDFKQLPSEDEAVVLRALLETIVSRAWCLRQPCGGSALLTFPSYFRRERKEQPSRPSVLVTYQFDGPIDDIYSTLVVLLAHTMAFESTQLWRSAADFKTQTGAALGFTLIRETEGTSRLEVYFESDVDANSRVLFLRYVHDHLTRYAQNVVRLRAYFCLNKRCSHFNRPFANRAIIEEALSRNGMGKVFCPGCGKAIVLHDLIEERFDSPVVKERVRVMQAEGQSVIDNESRELLAVHHTGFIVAEAGQIYRGYTNSDHGIDGEIEFKDNRGRASGKRLYLQLKSGDSYLKKRARDGAEVFHIKNSRWAEYWQQQAYAVMLVIRTSDGEIRWMDVSEYLNHASSGRKTVKQIVFDGERLDVMSVQRRRERLVTNLTES